VTASHLNIALTLVIAALAYFIWQDRNQYPVKSVNCSKLSGECFTTALHFDMQSCQWSNEHSNMGCEFNSDKSQAVCKVVNNAVAVGHCEFR
jgi:hypothetical protein